jgi:hypothetical protein
MNNQHTFKISPYPDPGVARSVGHDWRCPAFLADQRVHQRGVPPVVGHFDSETAAAQTVNRLAAYFNGRDIEWSR